MAPKVKSSRIIQVRKNADSDGTVTIVAITVPFNKISFFVSFRGFLSSFDNNLIWKKGNKNQICLKFKTHENRTTKLEYTVTSG